MLSLYKRRDATKFPPFRQQYIALLKNPRGAEFVVAVYSSRKPDKVAIVVNVKNNNASESWSLMEARLVGEQSGEQKPFAIRANKSV